MSTDLDQKKKELRAEINKLNQEFKVELPKRIAEARAYGDLKENAEYDAAREKQAFVKARITQLSAQLSQLNDLKTSNLAKNRVDYGSNVRVIEISSGDQFDFTVVSPNEVNPSDGKISLSSPIGKALKNGTAGETVEMIIPAGKRAYYIEKLITIHGNEFEKKYKE